MKLFSKKAYRACKNCLLGHTTAGGQHVLCTHKGVVDADFCCRKYRYDPLKRVPPARSEAAADERRRLQALT
jgi:hypothetical protein